MRAEVDDLPPGIAPRLKGEYVQDDPVLGRPEGVADEPTPLRFAIGARVRVNSLCDIRSLIGQTGVVDENFNFTVRVRFDGGAFRILRHESISAE